MSSQPPTTPRIEDLKARLRLDPKARHFYPLAEELRKLGQLDEAEKILRDGLTHHGTYLSAWMSLGRIHAEKGAHRDAVEALMKALALDPGNVVCARLLATSYLALGEKVEALKKMKLVRAVMPGDDELDAHIAALEAEVAGPGRTAGFVPAPSESEAAAPVQEAPPEAPAVDEPPLPAAGTPHADAEPEAPAPAAEAASSGEEGFSEASAPEPAPAPEDSDAEPPATEPAVFEPSAASPFMTESTGEPAAAIEPEAADVLPEDVFAPGFEAESPAASAMPESELPAPPAEEPLFTTADDDDGGAALPDDGAFLASGAAEGSFEVAREPFDEEEQARPAESTQADGASPEPEEPRPEPAAIADDQTSTLTMADLYAKQGHDDAAREIYERVLERDPGNEDVRGRLASLASGSGEGAGSARQETAARLERWLEKVGRRGL